MNQFTVSLWGDEGFSAILSMKPVLEIVKIITRDTSPPLYNITEHVWFQIFGTSEVSIRSLSFLYYLIAVFFVYKIGALLWNKKTGILAALLSGLNPFFFIYAFEGRMYSILAASVVASMYFFLKRNWVGYIIATTAALYSHHFSVFAILVQSLWFLYEFTWGKRKVAISMFKSFLGVGVLYLPWVIPLYNQTRMVGGGFWLGTPTLSDLGNLIKDYLAQGIKHALAVPAFYTVLAVLVLRKWKGDIQKTFFLAFWFLFPIILTWAISQKFQSIFFNRYLLYTIPGAMLILASGRRTAISSTALALLLIFFSIIDINYFTHPTKRPFRQLASYVLATQKQGDFLVNWNSKSHHLWETKYYKIPAPIYIPKEAGDLPFFVGTALMEKSDIIKEIPNNAKRVGVVTSGPIDEIMLPGYTLDVAKIFGDLKMVWYKKK